MQLMGQSSLTDRSDLVDWAEFPFICPENKSRMSNKSVICQILV